MFTESFLDQNWKNCTGVAVIGLFTSLIFLPAGQMPRIIRDRIDQILFCECILHFKFGEKLYARDQLDVSDYTKKMWFIIVRLLLD